MTEKEEKMVKMMICAFENRAGNSLDHVNLIHDISNDLLNCHGGSPDYYTKDGDLNYTVPGLPNSNIYLMTCANFKELFHFGEDIIIYNFLFNRTKAYYSDLKFNSKAWYHVDPSCYQSLSILRLETESKSKIFINPSKIYLNNCYKLKRRNLSDFLMPFNGYQSRIFIATVGAFENSCPPLNLKAERQLSHNKPQWLTGMSKGMSQVGSNYNPIHNKYYKDTFISIYAESTERSPLIYITEKTYDPLIKGHFILPFAAKDIIKYLKLEGFKFPEFIDYSYDVIYNDDDRYEVYIKEVERLVNLPLNYWVDQWNSNINILDHNQALFYNRDYYKIIDRLNNT